MESERRRLLLLSIGGTAMLSGCLGDGTESPTDEDDTGSSDSHDGDGANDPAQETLEWPAVDTGELITDFEDGSPTEPLIGSIEPAADEARIGSQAMMVSSQEDRAGLSILFPDGLDLSGWDTSLAVKAESIDRIAIEFHAPSFGDHLTSFRRLPNDHDDWLRVDFGYDEKQGDPELENVTELRIIGFGAADGPTTFLVDDLRRTEAVANGKAILACYDSHLSHFEVAAPMLAERGWPAVVATDPRRIGDSNRMGMHELHDLRDRGWDISPMPSGPEGLSGLPESEQRSIIETATEALEREGFSAGARHFFAPEWREMDPTNHALVRELHESAFAFGSSTSGIAPTAMHLIPMNWGPALHDGIRRQINIADQYQLLVVLRIPRLVQDEDDAEGDAMWVGDFDHLLDHLAHRGLDVITPSDLVDDTMAGDGGDDTTNDRPEGLLLESGQSHAFEGTGSDVTDAFAVGEGFLFASHSSTGSGGFAVDVDEVDGDVPNSILIRTADARTGESVIAIGGGTYQLDIDAEDEWLIELYQPDLHSDDVQELPLVAEQTGSDIIGPAWGDGDGRLHATHDGSGQFIVDLYGSDGSWEQLVNTDGSFDSSRSYRASSPVWLNVEADGDWSVELT